MMKTSEMVALSEFLDWEFHQSPRIKLHVNTAVSLSDTWALIVDSMCESSHSYTYRKLFSVSHHSAKVGKGSNVCDLSGEAPQFLMRLHQIS